MSGGAKRNGHTEARVMYDWLVDKGIKKSRIMRESTSASTVSNATNSMAILPDHPGFTSYTLISDSSHIRRATILFNAAKVGIQEKTGKAVDAQAGVERRVLGQPDRQPRTRPAGDAHDHRQQRGQRARPRRPGTRR